MTCRTTPLILVLALLAGCFGGSGETAVTSPTSESSRLGMRDMPPFSDELQAQQDFYRFKFLDDGYPGRDDGWAHPLYGVYILNDYLDQHEVNPTEELEQAIGTVARASVKRMDYHRGTLVFWYEPAPDRGARLYRRHYSGLTQGKYAESLYRAGERLDDPVLVAAAERVFDSLMVPVEQGGVLHQTMYGPVIAEVPQEPNSWILNGWLSALASVHRYAELSDSNEARSLVEESASAMAQVLPLYDVPALANSRYGLTGFAYVRINPTSTEVTLRDVVVSVPDEGSFPVANTEGTRWQNYFLRDDIEPVDGGVAVVGSSARLNAVLSLASAPQPNRLEFTFEAATSTELVIEIQQGSYDPLLTAPVDTQWAELATVRADSGDRITVDIPIETIEEIAYPTNFIKELGGKRTNVYHTVHIQGLRRLSEVTGRSDLGGWADRWEDYICDWSNMPLYDGLYARSLNRADLVRDPADFC